MSREHKPTDATLRMDRRQLLSGLASTGLLLSSTRNSFGQARVPVTGGDVAPLPIAIPNFVAGTPGDPEVGAGVSQVITNNLKRSGLFAPIDPAAYIERIVDSDKAPQFQSWKQINAQALVTGRMTRRATAAQGRIALGRQHRPATHRPAIFHLAGILAADRAHHLDQIYERRPARRGIDSRVVFMTRQGLGNAGSSGWR
jgi:TolB protein